MSIERKPGEPWGEFLSRVDHFAATWGVILVGMYLGASGAIEAHFAHAEDQRPQAAIRLEGTGGTIPGSPIRVIDVPFTNAGATGVTGEGDWLRPYRGGGDGPTGPTGPERE